MRVAVVGKGGAGKTTLVASMARLLGRRGRRVLAVDLDTSGGLATSLGAPGTPGGLPAEVLEENPGLPYGWGLRAGLAAAEVVDRYAVEVADGVRFLGIGAVDHPQHAVKRSVTAVRTILQDFNLPGWDVLGDIEAGPTKPYEGYHRFADRVLVVVGPGWSSALTARRLLALLKAPHLLVGNRTEGVEHDGLEFDAVIPDDPCVAAAARTARAVIDACPDSPVVPAVGSLLDTLANMEAMA
ncbi:MAG: nucleotide-binding protein [Candidatus Dormibacteria bacterium]